MFSWYSWLPGPSLTANESHNGGRGGVTGDGGRGGGGVGGADGGAGDGRKGGDGGERHGMCTDVLAVLRVQCMPPSTDTSTLSSAPDASLPTTGGNVRLQRAVESSMNWLVEVSPPTLQWRRSESMKPLPYTSTETGSSQ
eukprot:3885484-Prymnesium_polylepis.3